MLKHALSLFLLAMTATYAVAQTPAPSPSSPPPFLDQHDWEVQDGSGNAIGFHMTVTDVYVDPWTGDLEYDFDVIHTESGRKVATGSAYDGWGGHILDVTSSDSGLEYMLIWEGDHYEKVGGTANERHYYPI